MISLRRRHLGDNLGNLGLPVYFFALASTDPVLLMAIEDAKLRGNTALARAARRAFAPYLRRYFKGWALTVPRGCGPDSFMYRTWRGDPRFLPCFEHERPVHVTHDWRARLRNYPQIGVTAPVAGRRIVLLDDIVTTGKTLAAHLVPLLRAGATATALVLRG